MKKIDLLIAEIKNEAKAREMSLTDFVEMISNDYSEACPLVNSVYAFCGKNTQKMWGYLSNAIEKMAV